MNSDTTSKKRKLDHHHHQQHYGQSSHQPSHKKPRPENGHAPSHGGHLQGHRSHAPKSQASSLVLPDPLPALPKISPTYSTAVFTHASMATQDPRDPNHSNYERLEVLGDALLKDIATWVIFTNYPCLAPKRMSTIREAMDRNDTLAQFARAYGFDTRVRSTGLIVSSGKDQRKDWTKIHADVFEAYVGAIVLSAESRHKGFDIALEWLRCLWEPQLKELTGQNGPGQVVDLKSKEELARTVLVKGVRLEYLEEKPPVILTKEGTQRWFVGCYLTGWGYDNLHLGSGVSDSKSEAGQLAAAKALLNPIVTGEIAEQRRKFLEEKGNS